MSQLVGHTSQLQTPAGTKAPIVAKGTAASCHRPIDIRAGKTTIQAHLLHPSAKTLPQKNALAKVGKTIPPPKWDFYWGFWGMHRQFDSQMVTA
jgi:hypothetical protein